MVNSVHGFVVPKIQSLELSSKDCKKYGINEDDFDKADKNHDGRINASEFLSSGINILSIFNAFKTMAVPVGGFEEKTNQNDLSQNSGNDTNKNNTYNLSRPNVSNPYTANHYDYLA